MFCVRLDRPSRLGVAAVKSAQEVAGFFTEDVDVRIGGQLLGHTSPSSRAIAWRRLGSGKKKGRCGVCSGGFDPAADWRLPVSAGQ